MLNDNSVSRGEMVEKTAISKTDLESMFSREAATDRASISWREIVCVLLVVLVADILLYRRQGYLGIAAFLTITPFLLWFGSPWRTTSRWVWGAAGLLLVLAARVAWNGSILAVTVGAFLVCSFALAVAGRWPHILETVAFACQTFGAGCLGWLMYFRGIAALSVSRRMPRWINYVLPLAATLVFGSIFILANPNLIQLFSQGVEQLLMRMRDWVSLFSAWELMFWLLVACLAVGMLRPVLKNSVWDDFDRAVPPAGKNSARPTGENAAALIPAFRNTLLAVVVLFAVYLVFEFQTLWFREFPPGFHYSGYAHEGAAWLTCALGLATALLSLIFRGGVLHDEQRSGLKKLAWLWSAENFLLAIAVYHRMFIYIGFNGMTRMRIVGLLGISCVVVGLIFVLRKINGQYGFVWLLRRHLLTVAAAIYLYATLPVDAIVMRYNVQRILAGDPAPAVQISVHPIDAEGWLCLSPLLECDNEIIRDGLRAMHRDRLTSALATEEQRTKIGWTAHQFCEERLLRQLRKLRGNWQQFDEAAESGSEALKRFHDYAYQWY
jgi:hypothetical protein